MSVMSVYVSIFHMSPPCTIVESWSLVFFQGEIPNESHLFVIVAWDVFFVFKYGWLTVMIMVCPIQCWKLNPKTLQVVFQCLGELTCKLRYPSCHKTGCLWEKPKGKKLGAQVALSRMAKMMAQKDGCRVCVCVFHRWWIRHGCLLLRLVVAPTSTTSRNFRD